MHGSYGHNADHGTPALISDLIGDQRVSEPDDVPHDFGEVPRIGQRFYHLAPPRTSDQRDVRGATAAPVA